MWWTGLLSWILGIRWHLPRPFSRRVVREKDLRVVMDDGTVLLADRWVARSRRDEPQPTVLVRSCYGRRGFFGMLHGRMLAERGMQVVMQSVRGTFGSGGTFNPFLEREDGLATLRWLREQPWHTGGIGMTGESYLGLVQWAIAADAGDDLTTLSIHASASQFHGQSFPGGSMALQTSAQWMVMIALQERSPAPLPMLARIHKLRSMLLSPSLDELDKRLTGSEVAWFREALSAPQRDGSYWAERDFSAGVKDVTARVQMVTGWYDSFLPWQLEDYAALQNLDRPRQLIIGPWTHTMEGLTSAGVKQGLAWLRGGLLNDPKLIEPATVRLYVTGEKKGWRDYDRWPPVEGTTHQLWITGDDALGRSEPGVAGSRSYRYDPTDSTPSVGGPIMVTNRPVRDNQLLESRPDVVTFTSEPLTDVLEAIGPVRVRIFARGSEPNFDLFARVCDVDARGVSRNVSDALASVAPGRFEPAEDGSVCVQFDLWPIAHRFAAGHRVRLQVSSGAHPRYVRNPGSGENPLTAQAMRSVDVELLYGPDRPSSVILPGPGS